MSNEQPITKQNLECDGSQRMPYAITEVFETIQGEGIFSGRPALFIRLAGCNLRCFYCDTEYGVNSAREIFELVALFKEAKAGLVVITGGEPFRQNIVPLVEALHAAGAVVQIETNGTLTLPNFPWEKAVIVCSPKTGKIHPDIERHASIFRYTIRDGETSGVDGLPEASTAIEGKDKTIFRARRDIWVSPCDDHDYGLNQDNLSETINIARKFDYRLSLQIHKILELP